MFAKAIYINLKFFKFSLLTLLFASYGHISLAQSEVSKYIKDSLGYELLFHSYYGDFSKVKKTLAEGASIDFSNYDGITALMFASQSGNDTIVSYFIDNGAHLDTKCNTFQTSALTSAIKNDYLLTAEILIRNGANINIQDIYKSTPLHYSVGFGYEASTDMLLYYGADPNINDINGNSPLFYAVKNSLDSITEILIRANANMYQLYSDNQSLMHIAAYYGNDFFVKKYMKHYNLEIKDKNGLNPVDMAVAGGESEVLNIFLNEGFSYQDTINGIYTIASVAKNSRDKETKKIIRKQKKHIMHYQYYQRISLGTDFIFNLNDFYLSHNIGIKDTRYGIGLELGYMYRPFERKILIEHEKNIFYQVREIRKSIYLGISKDFMIYQNNTNSYFSLFSEFKLYNFWGKYDGLTQKPSRDVIFSPGIGLAFNHYSTTRVELGAKYMDTPILKTNPYYVHIGFKTLINFRSNASNEKYKYIINY